MRQWFLRPQAYCGAADPARAGRHRQPWLHSHPLPPTPMPPRPRKPWLPWRPQYPVRSWMTVPCRKTVKEARWWPTTRRSTAITRKIRSWQCQVRPCPPLGQMWIRHPMPTSAGCFWEEARFRKMRCALRKCLTISIMIIRNPRNRNRFP